MKQSAIQEQLCCKRDDKNVYLFTLTNTNGMVAKITNYGGIVLALIVPDKNGKFDDVALGLDSVGSYLTDSYVANNPRLGALMGRYANRIGNAQFTIDGVTYHLTKNSREKHSIHGGVKSFDKIVWDADTTMTENSPTLKLTHLSPDGDEGFPGNLRVTALYTLTNDNALKIDYYAETDKPTILNLTNHTYFNLTGEGNGNIFNHQIMINADKITPSDGDGIPTGEIKVVEGTPFDFRTSAVISDRMASLPQGYDNNYILNHPYGKLGFAARVIEPTTGRILETFTTEPGMQFYTASHLNGSCVGKSGRKYDKSFGLCLETQHFPDSPNKPDFPSTVLRPGEKFQSTTIYKFSIKKD